MEPQEALSKAIDKDGLARLLAARGVAMDAASRTGQTGADPAPEPASPSAAQSTTEAKAAPRRMDAARYYCKGGAAPVAANTKKKNRWFQ